MLDKSIQHSNFIMETNIPFTPNRGRRLLPFPLNISNNINSSNKIINCWSRRRQMILSPHHS